MFVFPGWCMFVRYCGIVNDRRKWSISFFSPILPKGNILSKKLLPGVPCSLSQSRQSGSQHGAFGRVKKALFRFDFFPTFHTLKVSWSQNKFWKNVLSQKCIICWYSHCAVKLTVHTSDWTAVMSLAMKDNWSIKPIAWKKSFFCSSH